MQSKRYKKLLKSLKKWSTRKTTLWFAVSAMTLYALTDIIYTFITNNYLDPTLTSAWFDAMKWVVGLGGGITVAGIVKGESKG